MLILTRKQGESLTIGEQIKITILGVFGRQVRLGIDAPPEVVVHREEVYVKIQEENREAVQASETDLEKMKKLMPEKGKKNSAAEIRFRKSGPGNGGSGGRNGPL